MKKIVFILIQFFTLTAFAQQEVTIKEGTVIPLQVLNKVRAAKLHVGDSVTFFVAHDIIVEGKTAIPYGTNVFGQVYKAKRSQWWGTKGQLGININEIALPNGEKIPLKNGDVFVAGQNRTALSVLLFLFITWPACFLCGSGAELPDGYIIRTTIGNDFILQVF